MTLGEKITRAAEIRDERKTIAARDKELIEEFSKLQEELLEHLDKEGTTVSGNGGYTVSVSEVIVPTAVDWEAIFKYIKDKDALYMLERRISSVAWRELHQSGETIPGTEPFTKRTINLRKSGN